MEELAAMRSVNGTTTGSDVFTDVNAHMGMLGLKRQVATTDGCAGMTGKNVRLLQRMQDKMTEIDPHQEWIFFLNYTSACVVQVSAKN